MDDNSSDLQYDFKKKEATQSTPKKKATKKSTKKANSPSRQKKITPKKPTSKKASESNLPQAADPQDEWIPIDELQAPDEDKNTK